MADNMKHPLSRSEYLFEFQRKKQNRVILNSKRNTNQIRNSSYFCCERLRDIQHSFLRREF